MASQSQDTNWPILEDFQDFDFTKLPHYSNQSLLWNPDTLQDSDALQDFSLSAPTLPHIESHPQHISKPISTSKLQTDINVSIVSEAKLNTSPLSTRVADPQDVPDNLAINNQFQSYSFHDQHVIDTSRKRTYETQHSAFNDVHSTPKTKRKKTLPSHHISSPSACVQVPIVRDSPVSQKTPADESRERHNKMMRENRLRVNHKFQQLNTLLATLEEPNCEYKPIKNKIQTLERAIYQYAQMETKKAKYENQFMFSQPNSQTAKVDYLKVFGPIPLLKDACLTAIANLCAINDWKYGQVWMKVNTDDGSTNYNLAGSHISKNNMPDARSALNKLSEKCNQQNIDPFLRQQAQYGHSIWIPNLSSSKNKCERVKDFKKARISTAVIAPLSVAEDDGEPDVIVVLMHVDDELLSFPKQIRPYDTNTMTSLLDLSSAIVLSRSRVSA